MPRLGKQTDRVMMIAVTVEDRQIIERKSKELGLSMTELIRLAIRQFNMCYEMKGSPVIEREEARPLERQDEADTESDWEEWSEENQTIFAFVKKTY